MKRIFKNRMFTSVLLSVVLTFAFVFAIAYSATTISTNIDTAGNITTSAGNLVVTAGSATIGGTLGVTGVTTMVNASTTQALTVAGATYLDGGLTMSTTKFSVNTSGLASTTSFRVGGGPDVSTVSGLSFGYCNMPSVTVAASSTAYGICTPNTASALSSSSFVFAQATSSLPAYFVIKAASSTAAGAISVEIANIGWIGSQDTGRISLNFIGIR